MSSPRPPRVEFSVLGPIQMTVDGTPVPLGTPKQRVVLSLLVMNRNLPVDTDALISAAWEDWPPPEARTSLHAYVSRLRRIFDAAGADARSTLCSAPPGYRLAVAEGGCDLDRFVSDKTRGVQAAAAGRFEQASAHMTAALAHWRGPVLADLRDFTFVGPIAAALVEDKLAVHAIRAEAEIACGRAQSVIGVLEALTAEHPYREPLWAQLITAYYCCERQSDALDAYRRLKTTLSDDLGIDPGPAVRALHERILRQEPLDIKRAAQATATVIVDIQELRTAAGGKPGGARLCSASGQCYPIAAAATRIGRLADNDIVLDDPKVSRHHAVVIDTGTSFTITDLHSANGVYVCQRRIRGSAPLTHSDGVRIGDHDFTFEVVTSAGRI